MNKLIYADDVVRRDKKGSVAAWICDVSAMRVHEKKIALAWDGASVGVDAVFAFVNNGRVIARCDFCGNHEYVSQKEPFYFCMSCGNHDSGQVRPVIFPPDWMRIEAALVARPIFPGPGLDEVQAVFRSRPTIQALKRNWTQSVSLGELIEQNMNYGIGGA
jgi:ribosomal protein L37E